MKSILLGLMLLTGWGTATAQSTAEREFIDKLMGRMTLDEKIGQLNLLDAGNVSTGALTNAPVAREAAKGRMGAVLNLIGVEKIRALQQIAVEQSRLGIPLVAGLDVIHGYETVFPIPLALASTWDLEGIEQSARMAAREATADGISWTFSPMVDIALDARWGRMAEGAGEDPFLGSRVAEAMVRGYQGKPDEKGFLGQENLMACIKHFALYGAAEAGRDYNTVDMSPLRMHNQYLPPYRAAVKAGAGSLMTSFNTINGMPATACRWLVNDLLRDEWGFRGMVVTDYSSIREMLTHGVGNNLQDASAMALHAGTDMDMCSEGFVRTLRAALDSGQVTEAEINEACRRVLEMKWRLGLFQNPYRYCDASRRQRDIYIPEHRAAARRMAAESFVLLKNKGNLLPLDVSTARVALIGPLADNRANMQGCWSFAGQPERHRYRTLREAFGEVLPAGRMLYAQGCNLTRDAALQHAAEFQKPLARIPDSQLIQAYDEALAAAREADVVVCAMGECADMSGESSSRTTLTLPDVQAELLRELVALGKPVVLLNFAGRATELTWEETHVDAILNVWFGGSEMADAICDVLFGTVEPGGRLTVSMPRTVGQEPLYYNHLRTGRPVPDNDTQYRQYQSNYLEHRNGPLYPFGYGLSYTTFAYSDVQVTSTEASVVLTNTGSRTGSEVVQLYICDPMASVARPVQELKGFRRLTLHPGESQRVSFPISRDMLSYYNAEGRLAFEPGEFEIMLGPNSANVERRKIEIQ